MACDYLTRCEDYGFICNDVMRGNCPTCYKPKTTKRKDNKMDGTIINTKIEFGKEYEDEATGFKGVVTGMAKYPYGGVKIELQPKADAEGIMLPSVWMPEEGLKAVPVDDAPDSDSPEPANSDSEE